MVNKDMLEKLDTIDWHSLVHAYGEADNVPDILRELALAKTKNERDSTCQKLFSHLCHQGTIYSATLAAVPFLIEILKDSSFESSEELLIFFRGIASAQEWASLQYPIRTALAEGIPVFRPFLVHGNPLVRKCAIAVLCHLFSFDTSLVQEIIRCIPQEHDLAVRASLLLSLVHDRESESEKMCREYLKQNEPLAATAAAFTLLYRNKEEESLKEKAYEVLLEAIKNRSLFVSAEIPAMTDGWIMLDEHLMTRFLLSQPFTPPDRWVRSFIALFPYFEKTNDWYMVEILVSEILNIVFGERRTRFPKSGISSLHKEVIDRILQGPLFEKIGHSYFNQVGIYPRDIHRELTRDDVVWYLS